VVADPGLLLPVGDLPEQHSPAEFAVGDDAAAVTSRFGLRSGSGSRDCAIAEAKGEEGAGL
ncbi:MAG: hypothetical protein WBP81_20670, partial [Solirubrobacteraceae bacterium]